MPRDWKTFGALAVAGRCATIGLATGTTEAQTRIKTSNVTEPGWYNDSGRTGNYQFVANNWDSRYQRYQQSLVRVSGQDGGKDMAHCLPPLGDNSLTEEDLASLGSTALQVVVDALAKCAAAGQSAVTDPPQDAVTLWLGLHGLAHQRADSRTFPWPEESITEAMITRLACLKET
ncbi:TetR-like C-terminal domain-containing protein [Streptomyces shenzhenensis]|uniref:TetR-like C-terminal domain-containing protein n=1 Tax=Streptomyces shenzhenensis TaxID=943815 RepID=UPI001F2C0A92|nr:TetR-like C-terminal domain-containing protein [Streptomyces shenzhenensis]